MKRLSKSSKQDKVSANKRPVLLITAIICGTIVILSGLGVWYVVERDRNTQRKQEIIKKEEMLHYEQEQLNRREEIRTGCAGDNPYQKFGLGC